MKPYVHVFLASTVALFLASGGCKPQQDEFQQYEPQGEVADPHEHEHEHGPHDGHIVELGSNHGEVVFDAASRKITVYILDGEIKNPVAIDQPEVLLNLTVDGNPVQLKLAAAPQEGETGGKSSRFEIAGDQVPESIKDEEDLQGRLAAKINNEDVSGEISHEGHDHDHEHEGEAHEGEEKPQ